MLFAIVMSAAIFFKKKDKLMFKKNRDGVNAAQNGLVFDWFCR